ncbi:hypothetical protein J6590_066252 [Homalodisca vitripennis]|nr:hypothetical protein J6590_066252 [Homalodisca vitripennis]
MTCTAPVASRSAVVRVYALRCLFVTPAMVRPTESLRLYIPIYSRRCQAGISSATRRGGGGGNAAPVTLKECLLASGPRRDALPYITPPSPPLFSANFTLSQLGLFVTGAAQLRPHHVVE